MMVVRWILLILMAELRVQSSPHVLSRIPRAKSTHQGKRFHPIVVSEALPKFTTTENDDVILRQASFLSNLMHVSRGGGSGGGDNIELVGDDDHDGFILQKVKNMIRSILTSTNNIPILQQTVSTFIQLIESTIGIRLMPLTKKVVKKKKKSKSKKQAIPLETIKGDSTIDKSTKQNKAKTKVTTKATKSASSTTKLQVKKDLKATNPNYRIQQELKSFLLDPPQYLSVKTGKNIRIWIVTIQGIGIYEGEIFKLRIQFPAQYPTVPPSVYFLPPTIPIHEHVYTNGDICLSLLGKDWRPTMTAQSIAHSILSILTSATSKTLPMDNARHATNQPGLYQENWVYHDDNC